MTHRCRCHRWVIGYLVVSAKKEEINLMILWESCWWRTHWKRVTLSLLPLFFLLFRHWSLKAYIAKRASIIACYVNMYQTCFTILCTFRRRWPEGSGPGMGEHATRVNSEKKKKWSEGKVIKRESDQKRKWSKDTVIKRESDELEKG
jgi:hypothetical protein